MILLAAMLALESLVGDIDGDKKPDAARLEDRNGELFLAVKTAAGREADLPLGASALPFLLDGKAKRLALADVTGDGKPEVLAGARIGDRGLLFVLRLEGSELTSLYPEADAFVSETGAFPDALSVRSDGIIEIAATDFTEDGPREALFSFRFDGKGYVLASTTPAKDEADD